MIYDLTILGLRPNTLGAVLPKLPDAVPNSVKTGKLLGCFTCEFGVLNRIAILSAYADSESLAEDRAAIAASGNPYGIDECLGVYDRCAYVPLPFMQGDIEPGAHGPFYEMRTYGVGPGGLQATNDGWAKAVPARAKLSPLLMVMTSIEPGAMRMLHIWPYKSLDGRAKARATASAEKLWPPAGGEHLTSLQSELFVATKFSPLAKAQISLIGRAFFRPVYFAAVTGAPRLTS